MRILIIGGTTFIGYYLTRRLIAHGSHDLMLFNRGSRAAEIPEGVQTVFGDRDILADYREPLHEFQPDVVVDMIPFASDDARLIINVCKEFTDRIVAISSCDVYRAYDILLGNITGELEPTPLTEESPLRKEYYPYRNMNQVSDRLKRYDKILAEMVFLNHPEVSGTILRLPMVYGPRDYQHRLFKYLKRIDDFRPVILLHEELDTWRSAYGYVENVAHAIALAIEHDSARGQVYNVGEKYNPTEQEWVTQIGTVCQWAGRISVIPKDKYPGAGSFVPQDLAVDSSKIRAELGYEEVVPLAEGLERSIAWERAHPADPDLSLAAEYEQEDQILKSLRTG